MQCERAFSPDISIVIIDNSGDGNSMFLLHRSV